MPPRRPFANRVLIAVGIVAVSILTMYLFVVLSRVLLVVFAGVLMAVGLGGGADLLRRRTPLGRPGGWRWSLRSSCSCRWFCPDLSGRR